MGVERNVLDRGKRDQWHARSGRQKNDVIEGSINIGVRRRGWITSASAVNRSKDVVVRLDVFKSAATGKPIDYVADQNTVKLLHLRLCALAFLPPLHHLLFWPPNLETLPCSFLLLLVCRLMVI